MSQGSQDITCGGRVLEDFFFKLQDENEKLEIKPKKKRERERERERENKVRKGKRNKRFQIDGEWEKTLPIKRDRKERTKTKRR